MTGIKVASTMMLASGGMTGIIGVLEPKDLEGLGPTALFAVITLASMSLLAYFVRGFVVEMRGLTREIAASNVHIQEVCARMNVRPCLLDAPCDDTPKKKAK